MKYFYVYYSYEEYGRGYIGKRECNCLPEEDTNYFGSFTDKTFNPTIKIILEIFKTREDALNAEVILHNFYNINENPHFANKSKQTSNKFYFNRKGQKHPKISGNNHPSKREELRKNLSEKRKGNKNPMYGMVGDKNPFYGKKHTEKTKSKIGLLSKERNSKNKWWVNSIGITKFQPECPGDMWKRGRVFK